MAGAAAELPAVGPRTSLRLFVKNSAANATRMAITSLIAVVLPAYLIHHLPVQTYGVWVIILNLGAYVGYLDFGVQTAVSKYIAEFEARSDVDGCGRCASVGFFILLIAAGLGVLLTLVLAWCVPQLFHNMPAQFYGETRGSLLYVGISLSVTLPASIFSTIFVGLQRYQVPLFTNVAGRLLYAAALGAAVHFHCGLVVMGVAVALANLASAALQIAAWRKLAPQVRVSVRAIDFAMLGKMARYCSVLTIWSVCMLFITGLDITIVGHYAFDQVAFYSVAAAPTSLILMIIGAVLGPLLPASSALATNRTPEEMGSLLLRSTRYATTVLLLTGLPLMVFGFPVLRIWVGQNFAQHSVTLLRMLLLANVIRQLCAPYATMIVATARQGIATAAAVTEGVTNVLASILLARHFGALGVAMGTLMGAVASVAMHFAVSMHFSRNLAVSRLRLFRSGIARPFLMAVPSALLLPYWWLAGPARVAPVIWIGWVATSAFLLWFGAMTAGDRSYLRMKLQHGNG